MLDQIKEEPSPRKEMPIRDGLTSKWSHKQGNEDSSQYPASQNTAKSQFGRSKKHDVYKQPTVRERLFQDTPGEQLKQLQHKIQSLEKERHRNQNQTDVEQASNNNNPNKKLQASDDVNLKKGQKTLDHTENLIDLADTLFNYNEKEDTVYLKSPTTGQVIRIKNPKSKIRPSENALLNLKHVEEQIHSQSVLPDFGYMQDNYIIDRGFNQSSWKRVSELIGNKDKFQWLMNYIRVKTLRKSIQSLEE